MPLYLNYLVRTIYRSLGRSVIVKFFCGQNLDKNEIFSDILNVLLETILAVCSVRIDLDNPEQGIWDWVRESSKTWQE